MQEKLSTDELLCQLAEERRELMKRQEAITVLSDELKSLLWHEEHYSDYKGWWCSEELYESNLTNLRKSIEAHKMAIRVLGGATV